MLILLVLGAHSKNCRIRILLCQGKGTDCGGSPFCPQKHCLFKADIKNIFSVSPIKYSSEVGVPAINKVVSVLGKLTV